MSAGSFGAMGFELFADQGPLKRDLAGVDGIMQSAGNRFARLADSIGLGVGIAIGQGIINAAGRAISAGVGLLAGQLQKGFTLAVDAEQAQISFETMLGSATRARQVLGDLTAFAAATPFELPELTDAARKLTAFGVSQQKLLSTLRAVGDVASGVSAPIGEIAEIYGKARVQGRLFAEDINQLTGRGVPVIQELAKQFGVADGAVRKLVETGQIHFKHLERAFESLSGKGGRFAGLMEKQSTTLGGRWSTLSDTMGQSSRRVAEALIRGLDLGGWVQRANGWVEASGRAWVAWEPTVTRALSAVSGRLREWAEAVPGILAKVTAWGERMWVTWGPLARQALQTVRAEFQAIGKVALAAFGGVAAAARAAMKAMGLELPSLQTTIAAVQDHLAGMEFVFLNLEEVGSLALQGLRLGFVDLADRVRWAAKIAVDHVTWMVDAIKQKFDELWETIKQIGTTMANVVTKMSPASAKVTQGIIGAVNEYKGVIAKAAGAVGPSGATVAAGALGKRAIAWAMGKAGANPKALADAAAVAGLGPARAAAALSAFGKPLPPMPEVKPFESSGERNAAAAGFGKELGSFAARQAEHVARRRGQNASETEEKKKPPPPGGFSLDWFQRQIQSAQDSFKGATEGLPSAAGAAVAKFAKAVLPEQRKAERAMGSVTNDIVGQWARMQSAAASDPMLDAARETAAGVKEGNDLLGAIADSLADLSKRVAPAGMRR